MPVESSLTAHDVHTEDLLSLREAARLKVFARGGKAPNLSTVIRWTTRGCLAVDGRTRVKLSTIKLPGGLRTSRERVSEFINQMNGQTTQHQQPVDDAETDRAERELQEMGIS